MKKLVRDRIPELSGRPFERVEGREYKSYLRMKLIEESKELWEASLDQVMGVDEPLKTSVLEETSDLITAALALAQAHGHCWEEIQQEIERKAKEKGGFGGGFVMEFPSPTKKTTTDLFLENGEKRFGEVRK